MSTVIKRIYDDDDDDDEVYYHTTNTRLKPKKWLKTILTVVQ